MKIVTYNVNGLRQRVSQFGSLSKLLNSFDADIICFQETKLRRQELKSDLVIADGYESFFSCTRTSDKGRTGYSGVATFCRVKSAFNSEEVALPVAAAEGFTGVLEGSGGVAVEGLEGFEKDDLCRIDNEGRCVVTDHGHFVLFNVYGPRAGSDDVDRTEFKLLFYKILQKRWELLLSQGRRIFVVGDLNIAPCAIDRCEAGPDFENNQFRRWFRSMLVQSGGSFFDVFRSKHPERRDAYTCWPSNTGAEQFNYGTRIDHMLCAGSCLHQEPDLEGHNILTCHVNECDILIEYKRWKDGNTPRYRWKGGLNFKLEGSDHAPVYLSLDGITEIPQHNTPSLASRYLPMICGLQQTLVSMLMKRKVAEEVHRSLSASSSAQTTSSSSVEKSVTNIGESEMSRDGFCSSLVEEFEGECLKTQEERGESANEATCDAKVTMGSSKHISTLSFVRTNKKPRKSQSSQLSLKSFFQKSPKLSKSTCCSVTSVDEVDVSESSHDLNKTPETDYPSSCINMHEDEVRTSKSSQDRLGQDGNCPPDKEKNTVALEEWRRIQQLMENSIPLCKGHQEPCVARVVKKPGPTFGRRFYVCARAEGPSSNPEANCNYFKWASSKSRKK